MTNEREKLFYNDLRLGPRSSGFDLMPNHAVDLDLAQGNDNIVQVLTMRLLVHKGELTRLGWADYGSRLHELIGELNNTRTHIKLMAFARSAIEQDPRVVEVISMEVEPVDKWVARLLMDVQLINEPNPLSLDFDLNLEAL